MFKLIYQLRDYFYENKGTYLVVVVTSIYLGMVSVLMPLIFGQIIDHMVNGTLTFENFKTLFMIAAILLITVYLMSVLFINRLYITSYKFRYTLLDRYFRHLLGQRVPFFDKFKSGDLLTRGTQDIQAISMSTSWGIEVLLDGIFHLALMIVFMIFRIDWRLTIFSVLPLLPIVYIVKTQGQRINELYENAQKQFSEVNEDVLEMVDGVRVIRAYAKEEYFADQFHEATQKLFDQNSKVAKVSSIFGPTVSFFQKISLVISLAMGTVLVAEQVISIGDMISFQFYLSFIIWPFIALAELVIVMRQGSTSYDRYQEVMHATDEMELRGERSVRSPLNYEMNNYHFHYETEENLRGIDLKIPYGKTVGIVGKTGAGKTTLLRQFLNQYPIGDGHFTLNHHHYREYDDQMIRNQIGYVPQSHQLFSRTIRENILFGDPSASSEELEKALKIADLDSEIDSFPDGLETIIGEKGMSLSGGQKQRVSLARALISQPELLILDDSLSAVDSKTEANIIKHLHDFRQNKTNIIVSHRLSAIRHADEILVMHQGEIIDRGTHEELIEAEGWYSEQWKLQNNDPDSVGNEADHENI